MRIVSLLLSNNFPGNFLDCVARKTSCDKNSSALKKKRQAIIVTVVLCSVRRQGRGVNAGMEIHLLVRCFSSHQVVAKIRRSLYIKFLRLKRLAAVNQSMKGKSICRSASWCLFLMSFNVSEITGQSHSVKAAEGQTT